MDSSGLIIQPNTTFYPEDIKINLSKVTIIKRIYLHLGVRNRLPVCPFSL